MVVVGDFTAFGFFNLCLAFAALQLSTFLDPHCTAGTSTTTSAQAPLLDSAAEVVPPLAAVVVLFVVVVLIYHHLTGRRPVAGAGNVRRSISGSGLLMFLLCGSVGTLQFIVFGGQAAARGGAEDHGALARALGLAALHALPAAATGTFFCGMMLIIVAVAHVRAGGEGTGAVAGDGPIQGLLRLLTKVATGMASTLVGLMLMALTLSGAI